MATHTDPVTGDALSGGEYLSWRVQGVIRNWTFLGLVTLATLVCWATRNDHVLIWWNLGASYLALVIESVVGIAMMRQTMRDASVIREVKRLAQHTEHMSQHIEHMSQHIEHMSQETTGS